MAACDGAFYLILFHEWHVNRATSPPLHSRLNPSLNAGSLLKTNYDFHRGNKSMLTP